MAVGASVALEHGRLRIFGEESNNNTFFLVVRNFFDFVHDFFRALTHAGGIAMETTKTFLPSSTKTSSITNEATTEISVDDIPPMVEECSPIK